MMIRSMTIISALLVTAFLTAATALAQSYAVGANDLLRLRVAVLNAADGTLEELPIVSGSVSVGADGRISVPLAGTLKVAGRTAEEIASEIETRLADTLSVSKSPRVAVDVERYAPVFLAGEVAQTGAFEFTPGLTVLKAVALAGGPAEIKPLEGEERNFFSAQGALHTLRAELAFLEMRHARLMAESAGAESFEADTGQDRIAAGEAAILEARNRRHAGEITSLMRAEASLKEALSVLESKLETNLAQLDRGRAEVTREENLAERGLVPASKAFERVRYVSDLESRVLDIERSILLAKQELQQQERARLVLEAARGEDISTELQQVKGEIAEIRSRMLTQSALMAEAAGGLTPDQGAALADPLAVTVAYRIIRERGGNGTMPADTQTALMPGDVVEVLFLPADRTGPSN